MAIVNATNVLIKIHNDPDTAAGSVADSLLFSTSANLTINRAMRDKTNKASGGYSESLAGLISWELSGDGFVDFTTSGTSKNTDQLFDQMILTGTAGNEAEITVKFTDGTNNYTGNAYITSLSIDAGVEENATYSVSIQGTGALTAS